MKLLLPLNVWHGPKDRIFSIDFSPIDQEFATAGTDQQKTSFQRQQQDEICDGFSKIWRIQFTNPQQSRYTFQYGLADHQSPVNCIRYSPNGKYLATASDGNLSLQDKKIFVYTKRNSYPFINSKKTKYMWSKRFILSQHKLQVVDITWTKDSKHIISASLDMNSYIFQVQNQIAICRISMNPTDLKINTHNNYIQGITSDGLDTIITAGKDRCMKIWKKKKGSSLNYSCRIIKKVTQDRVNVSEKVQTGNEFPLFFDQTIPTFFRRPSISPDGNLYLLPAGQWPSGQGKYFSCALVFTKYKIDIPSFFIPTKSPALVCKFNQKKYVSTCKQKLFDIPYTMFFAIATSASVLVYSTDRLHPLWGYGNHHMAPMSDLAWKGANALGACSNDGYISFMVFEKGLGQQIPQITQKSQQENQISKSDASQRKSTEKHFQKQQQKQDYLGVQYGQKPRRIIPILKQKF